jgi:transcriptional regulator GlxA family with amidase domain
LVTRRRSDPVKLELAARLRRETTLSIKAIAARVGLGSSKPVNRSLHDYMRGPAQGGAEVGTGQSN